MPSIPKDLRIFYRDGKERSQSYAKDLGDENSLLCNVGVINPLDKSGKKLLNPIDGSIKYAPHIKATGVWDTGCTGVSVEEDIAEKLGLCPNGKSKVHTAAGVVIKTKFIGGIVIEDDLGEYILHSPIEMTGSKLGGKVQVLLGMSIIKAMEFAISHGKFSWCCPPCGNPIDLKKKAETVNEKKKNTKHSFCHT